MKGRRASYLHPVRMYVFTSAIFFLLFFSLFKTNSFNSNLDDPMSKEARRVLIEKIGGEREKSPGKTELLKQLDLLKDTTRVVTLTDVAMLSTDNLIKIGERNYRSIAEYDSLEKALPDSARDGLVKRHFIKKIIDINNKYRGNPKEALDKLGESVLHRLPYMLFISLPLFALILKLVYIRRKWRQEFYFADHGVFTIHLYIFSFIFLLAVFGLDSLKKLTGWNFINFLIFILFVGLLFYLYKAMRKFYGQGRFKTFLKLLFVSFWSMIMMILLFACFMFFSVATL